MSNGKTEDPLKFNENYRTFLTQMHEYENKKYLTKIQDDKFTEFQFSPLKLDFVYAFQDTLAFDLFSKIVKENNIKDFIDIGSKLSSMLFFARLAKCFYLEVKNPPWSHMTEPFLNIKLILGEGQKIDVPDGRFKLVTSLHALEHFGLGRYGDTIDYAGDIKGIKEFSRVLSSGGHLILSVPYSFNNPRIWFHGERVYSKPVLTEMLKDNNFAIEEEYFISPPILSSEERDYGNATSAMLVVARKT